LDKCEAIVRGDQKGNVRENLRYSIPEIDQQMSVGENMTGYSQRRVAELDTLQAELDVLKHLQGETAAESDALLPAILDRAFKGEL
jgi:hypothetical protein